MTRRKRLLSDVAVAFAVLILAALGTWQVQRLHWKEALIAQRAARASAPPLTAQNAPANLAEAEFRSVEIEGVYRTDKPLLVGPRSCAVGPTSHSPPRSLTGQIILTPFRLADGRYVFVTSGMLLTDGTRFDLAEADHKMTAKGLALGSEKGGWLTPPNLPEKGQWFTIDILAMAAYLKLPSVLPWYVDACGHDPSDIPNDHLQYAITWYSLGLALIVMYLLARRKFA